MALREATANQLRGKNLRWSAEEGVGKGWKMPCDELDGYGSGLQLKDLPSLPYALPWSRSGSPHKTHQLRDAQAKKLLKELDTASEAGNVRFAPSKTTRLESSGYLAAKTERITAHPSWEDARKFLRSRKQSPIACNIVAGQEPAKASSKPTAHCDCWSSTSNLA